MIKIKLCLGSDYTLGHDVFIEVEWPVIPRIGEDIMLTEQQVEQFNEAATRNVDTASDYARKYFFGESTYKEAEEICQKDLKTSAVIVF